MRLAILVALLVSATARADSGPSSFQLQASVGHEQNTSPLIRISDDGTLIFVDGLARLTGNYINLGANGMTDWAAPLDGRLAVSGRVEWKRSPDAPDLDFGQAQLDAAWHWQAGIGTLGLGASLQRLWVAGSRFRDVDSLHGDWTLARDDGSHWVWLLDLNRNRHSQIYADLDSQALSLSLHRHLPDPMPGLHGLDVEAGLVRERNAHGFSDLSNRSGFLRVGVDRNWAGTNWGIGLMGQIAHFDAGLMPGIPARHDRFLALDLAASKDLGSGLRLQFDTVLARNQANSPLYQNRYRQVSLTLSAQW